MGVFQRVTAVDSRPDIPMAHCTEQANEWIRPARDERARRMPCILGACVLGAGTAPTEPTGARWPNVLYSIAPL